MSRVVLCYHDIVEDGALETSGFSGPDVAPYKVDRSLFERHLNAVAGADCLFTFDDGGAGAYKIAAPMLEAAGRRGLFFIPTDYIGAPGFLTALEIRALARRGHQIGSHSCSHRGRMPALSAERLRAEWRESGAVLSNLVGCPVTSASVPFGYYSRKVASAAAQAGIKRLFTLAPIRREQTVDGCAVLGRYLVRRGASAETVARLVRGEPIEWFRHCIAWTLGEAAKRLLGGYYSKVRHAYFTQARRVERPAGKVQ